ncbi:MAG: peptidoglycan DD-metalloendopeptidase family protein [bacterium]
MALYHQSHRLERQRCSRRRVRPLFIYLIILAFLIPLLIKWAKGSFLRSDKRLTAQSQKETGLKESSSCDTNLTNDGLSSDPIEGPLPHPSYSELYLSGKIGEGESIYECLHKEGVSDRNIQLIASNLNPLMSFRSQSQPGDTYRLALTREGDIERFEYQKGPLEIYCLSRDKDNIWKAWRENIKLTKYWMSISGQIEGSLVSTFQKHGYPVSLALRFAEILEWKIDFQHEVRDGDRFSMVYERYYKGDEPIGFGNILAVMYEGVMIGTLKGFYFDQEEGRGDYYDLEGVSLRRAFLRAPLSYKYISSGFNHQRKHPILGYVRPHLGIDFAAPSGSPVWAVADGRVLSKSYDRNNGNQIKLRHMNGYITYYNHLSGFAKGIKKGVRVVQKQIIGYVGTTGLSTGPHLDYRVKKDSKFINPLKAKYPSGKPLNRKFLPEFQKFAANISPFLEKEEKLSRTLIAEVDSSEISQSFQ